MSGYVDGPQRAGVQSRRDRNPGGGKPPKQKKPRKPLAPNPLAGLPGVIDVGTGKVGQVADRYKPTPKKQTRETYRRQRILKSLGYSIVVDGIWGPRSQRAWQDYVRRQRTGGFKATPYKREGRAGRAPIPFSTLPEGKRTDTRGDWVTPEEQAAFRQQEREAAIRQEKKRQATYKAKIMQRASDLRVDPLLAQNMNLRQIAEVILDPETKVNVTTREGAEIVQTWLTSHGFHNVKETGVYDKQTHEALQMAFRRAEKRATRKRVQAIREQLYAPKGIKPGDKPSWWPDKTTAVPSPEKLDAILQKGGFEAKRLLKALMDYEPTFADMRQTEMIRLAAELGVQHPGEGMGIKPQLWEVYASILGTSILAGGPDLSGLSEKEREEAWKEHLRNPEFLRANAGAVTKLRTRVKALMSAGNMREFRSEMLRIEAQEEEAFRKFQEEIAGTNIPWWGRAIEKVLLPGDFMRSAAVYGTLRGLQEIDRTFFNAPDQRDITWDDARAALGMEVLAHDYDGQMEVAGRWRRFGFELVADPLNFIPPLKIASTAAKYGTLAVSLGRAGHSLGGLRIGDDVLRGRRGWLDGKGFVYDKGTWKKMGVVDAAGRALPTHFQPLYEKMVDEGYKYAQLKDRGVAKATRAVAHATRLGFEAPKRGAEKIGWKFKPKNAQRLKMARADVKDWLLKAPEMRELLDELRANWGSLYVDANRETYSSLGASLLANLSEKARIGAVHQLATDSADAVARSLREAGLTPQEVWVLVNREYADMVDKAGAYIMGGPGEKSLSMELYGRTVSKMDEIEHVLLPAIQDIIEEQAEVFVKQRTDELLAEGLSEVPAHPLWGADDLWVGRDKGVTKNIRVIGADSFTDDAMVTIKNPRFGHEYTQDEALELIEQELRHRIPRIYNYLAREQAGGRVFMKDLIEEVGGDLDDLLDVAQSRGIGRNISFWDADEAAEAIREHLHRNVWEKRDGMWFDKRETIEVSALYSRHLTEAYGEISEQAKARLDRMITQDGDDVLEELALPPVLSGGSPIDEGLWQMTWIMGSRYPTRTIIDHPTRRIIGGLDTTEGVSKSEAIQIRDETLDRHAKFNKATARLSVEIAQAADEMLPGELLNQRLFMVALKKAQSRYAKVAYHTLLSSMYVWRFATLPLRLGWVVRNQVDNVAKAIVAGLRDPRRLFQGAERPGQGIKSVLGVGIAPLRAAVGKFDELYGTKGLEAFDRILKMVWEMGSGVVGRLFKAHGLPEVPEMALDGARLRITDMGKAQARMPVKISADTYRQAGLAVPDDIALREARSKLDSFKATGVLKNESGEVLTGEQEYIYLQFLEGMVKANRAARFAQGVEKFADVMWDLFGNRPENYMKRVIYRNEYDKAMRELRPLYTGAIPDSTRAWRGDFRINDDVLRRVRKVMRVPDDVDVRIMFDFDFNDIPRNLAVDDLPELADDFADGFSERTIERLSQYGDDAAGVGRGGGLLDFSNPRERIQIDGVYRHEDKAAIIFIGDDVLGSVRTQAHLDSVVEDAVFTMLHELQHATQWARSYRRRISEASIKKYYEASNRFQQKWGSNLITDLIVDKWYRLQLHELDANMVAALARRPFAGLVEYTGPAFRAPVDEAGLSIAAHEQAWDRVTETLFDYGKIATAEDTLKVIFPFIQFWRKNTGFWVKNFADKPWMSNAILQFDRERQEVHADLPPWLRRYLHVDEIVDAAGVVPGLDRVIDAMLPDDAMIDPMSYASFAPLYRAYRNAFYGENQLLPGENPGMAIIGPMLDAMNDWGLSMNPLVRKPMEAAGIATERAWQSIFPQTPLATALTRKFFGDEAALKVSSWESLFEKLPLGASSDAIADNFEFYVQQEIAGQVARGEEPDRAEAEKVIRAWFLTQNIYGYFVGTYFRRATPEDIYLSKLQYDSITEQLGREPTEKEQTLLKLWGMRGMDRLTYERYLDLVPIIEAYYATPDWDEKDEMVRKHPGLRQWVNPIHRGKPFGAWLKNTRRYTETQKFFKALKVVEAVDPPHDVREAAMDMFASDELRQWWARNDVPKKVRERIVRGEVHRHYKDLSSQYHSIPATDYEARDGFLEQHPELIRYWHRNNSVADDFEDIISGANAMLREQYFDIVEKKGWDAAAELLKRHPFMFEDTKAAAKVDEDAGEWKTSFKDGKWSAERQAAWREVKPHMEWFFDTHMKAVGQKQAWAWLESSDTPAAKLIREYLKKWGKASAKSVAFLKAKPWLELYWDMPPDERSAWLEGGSEGAKIVKAYFEKYASKKGTTQHARDYLAAKPDLDFYFGMEPEKRTAWLKGNDPRAVRVREYFKKYGKQHQYERLLKKYPQLANGTPEQRKRLEFWREYFSLTPDKRPAFILKRAEDAGVFIYGEFGEAERHDQQMEWDRRSVGLPLSERQKAFLYVKPLLDFYRTLEEGEKGFFLRLNPELQEYFDKYSQKSVTGDKKLDALVEQYFSFAPDSFGRSQFLRKHPEVQDWFDSRSSPAERAMRNILEQYFELNGIQRKEFLARHPEIQTYFERRRDERSAENAIYDALDEADPRLKPFLSQADQMIEAAELMRQQLRQKALKAMDELSVRRDRRQTSRAYV